MFLIYSIIFIILAPVLLLLFLLLNPGRFYKEFASSLSERLGFPEVTPAVEGVKVVWIHAASVGEVQTVEPLIRCLRSMSKSRIYIHLSVNTSAAREIARDRKLADSVGYAPVDLMLCVNRYYKTVKPVVLVLTETEIWPNMIQRSKVYGTKVVIVNGRISSRTLNWYKLLKPFFKNVFAKVNKILARGETDAARFIEIGAGKDIIEVTGNMKFDQLRVGEANNTNKIKTYKSFGVTPDKLIFVAGSVREKEESLVVETYHRLLSVYPELKLIIALRHNERVGVVEDLLFKYGVSYNYYSKIKSVDEKYGCQSVIIDTYGVLKHAYSIATVVFVGGSLVPAGGHNVLEPAAMGKPVIFGKYMDNFEQPAEKLVKSTAGVMVNNEEELYSQLLNLFKDAQLRKSLGDNAVRVVETFRGASERNCKYICDTLGI
ncbi:MAG: 3-deoxy-D-manno-octulosonic acid transferase [Elusimicrobiota bacterium]